MFEQFKLPYSYDALEPQIDALTVETHHGKHHATYTANLNKFAEEAGVADKEITELLGSLDTIADEKLRTAIKNNGGGFYNHNLYFMTLSPNGGGVPGGILAEKIDQAFGDFDAFKEKLSALALSQFGSGWAWLSTDKSGNLVLSQSLNQDNPISQGTGNIPIFTIDVWEHAYYLKYKNLRADYIKAIFNIADWNKVAELYEAAIK
ncbi:MAG: superoxide dismutase [Lachnospiraceae bacterium]|nr:superoxide dismutase [Lachnospiraceae bacterium]